MMNRFFILSNANSLEVIAAPYEEQPENSLPFFNHGFVKPVFNVFPNPTTVIEGATDEEIAQANKIFVPEVLSRRQFKISLAVLGYQEEVILNGIEQLPEPNKTIARISYNEAGTFERNNPELLFVAENLLELSVQQIDEVFINGYQY